MYVNCQIPPLLIVWEAEAERLPEPQPSRPAYPGFNAKKNKTTQTNLAAVGWPGEHMKKIVKNHSRTPEFH